MIKDFLFKDDARNKLFKGVEAVYNAVSPTLGPRGKLVAIDTGYHTDITKDGVSVARQVFLKDKFENLGVQLAKECAIKAGDVGDGTTTTCILAYALAKEGLKALTTGVSSVEIISGMKKAVEKFCKELENKAVQITSNELIYNVAKISSNGDEKIASLVKQAFEEIGNSAKINVDESNTSETYLEVKKGLSFDKGYISPYFSNNEKMESELKDAFILVTDQTISTVNQIIRLLNDVAGTGRPLVIIAEDVTGEALPVLIQNNLKGALRVNAIKAPSYGSNKKEILQDIAIMTGATFVSNDFGISVNDVSLEMLGSAEKVISNSEETIIVGGKGKQETIENRINELKILLEEEKTQRFKDKIRERISKFNGGVCVINIAAQTEAQMKEIKDRVDDTICAVRASIKNGVITGGGVSLLLAGKASTDENLNEGELIGWNIVKKALEYPLRKLAENAGMSPDVVLLDTLNKSDGKSGYNILTREWDEKLSDKVIDPVLVETSALKNALSITSLLLNTEVSIVEIEEEKQG